MWKIIVPIACCVALSAIPAKAQIEEGDTVAVTKASELRIQTTVVASLRVGQELQIRKIEGPWLWAATDVDGKNVRGWIARDAVKFVRKPDSGTEGPSAVVKQPRPTGSDS